MNKKEEEQDEHKKKKNKKKKKKDPAIRTVSLSTKSKSWNVVLFCIDGEWWLTYSFYFRSSTLLFFLLFVDKEEICAASLRL